jgi:hypothetical protein
MGTESGLVERWMMSFSTVYVTGARKCTRCLAGTYASVNCCYNCSNGTYNVDGGHTVYASKFHMVWDASIIIIASWPGMQPAVAWLDEGWGRI